MKFSAAAVLALVAAVSAGQYPAKNETVVYTTEVVTALTTYCPEATTLTHNGKTYTVTEATTLTITDCPCTISKPVWTSSYVVYSTCNVTTPTQAPYTTTTTPYATGKYTPTYTSSPVTAGAGKVVASGAGLLAVLGLAALL